MNGLEVKETVADAKQAAEGEELFGADNHLASPDFFGVEKPRRKQH